MEMEQQQQNPHPHPHDDYHHQNIVPLNNINGFQLLYQQYACLLKKNLLLAWRNKRATFLQLFSSVFFIFLMFAIGKANHSRLMNSKGRREDIHPKPTLLSPPIPPCEHMLFNYVKHGHPPCYDFIWSGSRSPKLAQIVAGILNNNPGRPIPMDRTKSFATKEEVQKWLTSHPGTCPGALHFAEQNANASVITYGIELNTTKFLKRGRIQDPTFKYFIPLQLAAEREITRLLIGDPNFSWDVGLMEYAHPALEPPPGVSDDDGPIQDIFLLASAMFAFVFQISSLVVEKELKLRQAMNLMGLLDTAYWLSWLTWESIMTVLSSLMTVLFGMVFHLDFFLKNSFAVVFVLFFLFQLCMTGFAFMISTLIDKASSANVVGFIIFIIGFITQVFFGYDISSSKVRAMWLLFPPNLFNWGLDVISNPSEESGGFSWSMRTKCADGTLCKMTLNGIYIRLGATFFLWLILAIYFDNVIPNPFGVRKPILYFLNPGYWLGKGGNTVEGGIFSCFHSVPPPEPFTRDDEDVLEEENNVKLQAQAGSVDPNIAVQIRGLVKTYPATTEGCCRSYCCKRKKTPPFHAIKGLWLNFPKDQLFCLLGPNGAGKTTVLNCLTGLSSVTGGDALIYGHSIRNSVGMTSIRKIIGVCPQFDILWELLTGQEHLELFAKIKGLPPASIKLAVNNLIEEVKLTNSRNVRAGSYSGGMKRRLSVAAALIGDPKLVILDEPTSGMDPITRRYVWDIIENAKKGRAIILTTHSMEEADILGDRIGIMARGRLRCIGTTIRLKSRFGTGFVATVSFNEMNTGTTANNQEAVKQFFKTHLGVVPKEVNKSFLTFVIPRGREELLTKFFRDLQYRERQFGIADIQLGLATLEEVFLNIAKQAELENALAEGRFAALTLPSNISIQVPYGARFAKIPGTESAENPQGLMVEVYWQQDDSGALCISGHSPETPLPPHAQQYKSYDQGATSSTASNHHIFFGGTSGPVQGIELDPNQIMGSYSR